MEKQTAVEWIEGYLKRWNFIEESVVLRKAFEQAKNMERQQIENAYWDGGEDIPLTEKRCEEYYNKTFNK
jgi:hypothetical protein